MAIRNPSALLSELGATGDPASYLGGDGIFRAPAGFGIGDVAELGIGVDVAVVAGDIFDGSQLYSDALYSAFGLANAGTQNFPPAVGTPRDGETWIALGNQPASSGAGNGSVVVGLFKRIGFAIARPRVDHPTGTYNNDFVAAITCGTPGVDLRYTLDGSDVTESSPLAAGGNVDIDGAVTVAGVVTLKYRAFLNDEIPSAQGSAVYTMQAALPAFDPPPPSLVPLSVTAATATTGATMRYTTDGSTPTIASALYSVPVALVPPQTIKAVAMKSGYLDSAVAVGPYTATTPALIATIFGGGEQGGYWDFTDPDTLYQDDARTIPIVDGARIALAYDLSGNANHLGVRSAYNSGPHWSGAGYTHDAFHDHGPLFYIPGSDIPQPYTFVIAYKLDDHSSSNYLANAVGPFPVFLRETAGFLVGHAGISVNLQASDLATHVQTLVYNGAASIARQDGVEHTVNVGANPVPNGISFSVGASELGDGIVGRMYAALLIDRALTPTERANVEALFLSLM